MRPGAHVKVPSTEGVVWTITFPPGISDPQGSLTGLFTDNLNRKDPHTSYSSVDLIKYLFSNPQYDP